MDNIVSSESVALHEQIRTESEVEAREQARVEQHAKISIEHANHTAAASAIGVGSVARLPFFVVKLADLPGPVRLTHTADGSVVFEGEKDVSEEILQVESRGFVSDTLKITLVRISQVFPFFSIIMLLFFQSLPVMQFKSDFVYHAKEGRFIYLEGTDEGLQNSQRTDPK